MVEEASPDLKILSTSFSGGGISLVCFSFESFCPFSSFFMLQRVFPIVLQTIYLKLIKNSVSVRMIPANLNIMRNTETP
jgi:hypothetical protein